MSKHSPGVEYLIKQQVIRPSKKLVSETILIPAELDGTGDRSIKAEGVTVQVIRVRPRRERGRNG
jgi:hypothetical protein